MTHDASWVSHGMVSGLGWIYRDIEGVECFGLEGCRKSPSTLYASMLKWKNFYGWCSVYEMYVLLRHMLRQTTYLVDMIADTTNWPAFAWELVSFRFHILKSSNLPADFLTKEVKTSCVLFLHIDQIRSNLVLLSEWFNLTTWSKMDIDKK